MTYNHVNVVMNDLLVRLLYNSVSGCICSLEVYAAEGKVWMKFFSELLAI
jgi:hypothetical protein